MEQFITDFQQALTQKQLKYNLWQPMLFYKHPEKLLNLMRDPNKLEHTDSTDYAVMNLHNIAFALSHFQVLTAQLKKS